MTIGRAMIHGDAGLPRCATPMRRSGSENAPAPVSRGVLYDNVSSKSPCAISSFPAGRQRSPSPTPHRWPLHGGCYMRREPFRLRSPTPQEASSFLVSCTHPEQHNALGHDMIGNCRCEGGVPSRCSLSLAPQRDGVRYAKYRPLQRGWPFELNVRDGDSGLVACEAVEEAVAASAL